MATWTVVVRQVRHVRVTVNTENEADARVLALAECDRLQESDDHATPGYDESGVSNVHVEVEEEEVVAASDEPFRS